MCGVRETMRIQCGLVSCVFVHIHTNMHIRSAQVYMKCSPIIAIESREVTEGSERRRLPVVVYSLLSSSATCLSTAFSPAFSSSVSQHWLAASPPLLRGEKQSSHVPVLDK